MQSKHSVILKILLNKFHAGPPQTLLKHLPQEDAKEVLDLETTAQDPDLALAWPTHALARTHYSWLAPVVALFPKSIQTPLVSSLPPQHAEGLQRLMDLPAFSGNLPKATKTFLLSQLYSRWQPEESLPPDFLPKTALTPLLSATKNELVDLIDILGIYDLAEGIRHIVDKNKLKNIYLCLTPQKQQFLRLCLHKKEKLASPKLDIGKWNGGHDELNRILHKRGIVRLGKAISGQGRHFLWHICHTLDTGRGTLIASYYQDDETPGITQLLGQQALAALNFLQPKGDA